MRKRPTPQKAESSAPNKRNFIGTDNPRHLRALQALMVSPQPRESIDSRAGCSNGPELVAELRRRGLDVPCEKTPCIDRDGFEVKRGIYYLSARDRRRIRAWLARRRKVSRPPRRGGTAS